MKIMKQDLLELWSQGQLVDSCFYPSPSNCVTLRKSLELSWCLNMGRKELIMCSSECLPQGHLILNSRSSYSFIFHPGFQVPFETSFILFFNIHCLFYLILSTWELRLHFLKIKYFSGLCFYFCLVLIYVGVLFCWPLVVGKKIHSVLFSFCKSGERGD